MLRPGQHLGPYVLEQKLGGGSFGEVWRATRRGGVAIPVALKIPRDPDTAHDEFLKEAQIWAAASGHPNVVPVIDAAVYNDMFVLVSEYVAGGSLRRKLPRPGAGTPASPLSLEEAVPLLDGVLAGLEFLHARGIIHRDLKPENILLQEGVPRLTDFGVSRVLTRSTRTRGVSGTILYLPPEAFDGHISARTDVWAAGVLCYELLTGDLPFTGANEFALMKAIHEQPPRPLAPTVPPAFRDLIARALEKDERARYASAAEMRRDLAAAWRLQQAPPPEPGPDWYALLSLTSSQARAGGSFSLQVQGQTRVVSLSSGVRHDQKVDFPGLGGPGRHGGPPGVLQVTVQVRPDLPPPPVPEPGPDWHALLSLTAAQARQGGSFPLQVQGQPRVVSLRPGAIHGAPVTLPALGGPGRHGGPPGALHVTLQVQPDPAPPPPAPEPNPPQPRPLPRSSVTRFLVIGAAVLAGGLAFGPLRGLLFSPPPPGGSTPPRANGPAAPQAGPTIRTTTLPPASHGEPYKARLDGTGNSLTWTWETAQAPAGLTLAPDGAVRGTPTRTGQYPLTVAAVDGSRQMVTRPLTLTIQAARSVREEVERIRQGLVTYERDAARASAGITDAERAALRTRLLRLDADAAAAVRADSQYADAYLVRARILYSLGRRAPVPWRSVNQAGEKTTGDPRFAAQRREFGS